MLFSTTASWACNNDSDCTAPQTCQVVGSTCSDYDCRNETASRAITLADNKQMQTTITIPGFSYNGQGTCPNVNIPAYSQTIAEMPFTVNYPQADPVVIDVLSFKGASVTIRYQERYCRSREDVKDCRN